MNLHDRVVLITGSTGGLGREFVRGALARGASKVYATARRDVDWIALLGADAERVVPLTLEVTDPAQIAATALVAADVDVLVNNAGMTGAPSLLTSPIDEIRGTYETNLFGPLELTRAFAPVLAGNGGGGVLNVLSVMSWLTSPGAYSPTKSAFWGLTNALRVELADQDTQVLGAHLAYADTEMTAHLDDVPKSDPAVVVAAILDAFEAGRDEALADDITTSVHAALPTLSTGSFTRN